MLGSKFLQIVLLAVMCIHGASGMGAHAIQMSKKASAHAAANKPSKGYKGPWVTPKEIADVDMDAMTVTPKTVEVGTLSDDKPQPGPPIRPTIVDQGELAKRREVEDVDLDAEIAEAAEVANQTADACMVAGKTHELAQFLYSMEPENKPDGSSKDHVLALVEMVCPEIKEKYPKATKSLKCGKAKSTLENAYNDKYVGKHPLEPCDDDKKGASNFAMLQALHSVRTFWTWDGCTPEAADVEGDDGGDLPELLSEVEELEANVGSALD